jgi:hypothetical protein
MLALGGCGWPGLIAGALATPTSGDDSSTNVAIADGVAYVARSARGIERIDLATGRRSLTAPPASVDRIDDVAVSDSLLFALDATPPGHLLVYRIGGGESLAPVALSEVAVGPFSGVAAGGGHVIVSGGTSELSLRRYGADGALGSAIVTADFGRGQPDIALAPGGGIALISTHVRGPRFGLTVAVVSDRPLALHARGYVELAGAGFTPGGFHPANFPLQSAALGHAVLVAHGDGLSVLDTPPGTGPVVLGTTPLALHATAIAVDAEQSLAFVVGVSPRPELLTLDLADPRAPRIIARHLLPAEGSPSSIAFDRTHLVVAMQDGGVYIQARPAPASVASNLETVP